MMRYSSLCSSYDYGNAEYWNTRYLEEAGASFDWYQRYSALRPFVRKFVPSSSRILMVGCGIDDLFCVDAERRPEPNENAPRHLLFVIAAQYCSVFYDVAVPDSPLNGTLDSLMCGTDAPFSASQMIYEVNRLLKPGGIFMLITYGDPSVRIPHLNQPGCCWKFTLYIIPRPDFKSAVDSSSLRSVMEPVPLTENGLLPPEYVLQDPESHYIYFCKKMEG